MTNSRQFINANTQDLLSIFRGQDKIQFHQIMSKLSQHLWEIEPITLEFEIDREEQFKKYVLPVECFSESQSKFIDFIQKHNYEFTSEEDPNKSVRKADENLGIQMMGVRKHQAPCDSIEANTIKKREVKSNAKITESIDKIKQVYRHMTFYNALVPSKDEGLHQ